MFLKFLVCLVSNIFRKDVCGLFCKVKVVLIWWWWWSSYLFGGGVRCGGGWGGMGVGFCGEVVCVKFGLFVLVFL